MDDVKKKELNKLLRIAIPFFIGLFFLIRFYIHDAKQLRDESEYTKGVITELYVGAKSRQYVRFEFSVNNVKYSSSTGYSLNNDILEIGDTCFVIYVRSNPENCKLEEINERGRSIIKTKRLLDSYVNPDSVSFDSFEYKIGSVKRN